MAPNLQKNFFDAFKGAASRADMARNVTEPSKARRLRRAFL
jgi:hypothetical protein